MGPVTAPVGTRPLTSVSEITLAQAEIAYRRGNYDAARSYVQTVTPVFTRKDAEPYQKRALESLRAALDKPLPRKLRD